MRDWYLRSKACHFAPQSFLTNSDSLGAVVLGYVTEFRTIRGSKRLGCLCLFSLVAHLVPFTSPSLRWVFGVQSVTTSDGSSSDR